MASYGIVVVAAEHRDGSGPISYIHSADQSTPKAVDYRRVPQDSSPKAERTRIEQLRIRLWELGLIHDALLKIDQGLKIENVAPDLHQNSSDDKGFASLLDIHTPGKIAWAGHSFGASTVIQFVKSIYYPPPRDLRNHEFLYTPSTDSALSKQITASSSVTLLDLWALPLQFSDSWLLRKPLPAYDSDEGSAPLAVLSEAFFKWKSNLNQTKNAVSPPKGHHRNLKPNIFYPIASAHLSQSDFGPLFPWLTKKVFKAEDPERTLRLNVRAMLESLRRNGIKVADTSAIDMELSQSDPSGRGETDEKRLLPLSQDHRILAADGSVKGWIAIPLDERDESVGTNGHAFEAENPSQAVMKGEVMKN